MRISSFGIAATIAPLAIMATPASAQADKDTPEAYAKLLECRGVADDAERLACFDVAVGRLETAKASDEVVIVSREQVEATKRGLFGLKLPKIRLFGNDDEDETIKELVSSVAAVARTPRGGWVVTLEDGAVWEQTDTTYVGRPKVGEEVVIRRAALGSYMAKIDGGIGFRVTRRD